MPPVIGWAAVRGQVSDEALVLFMIVFLWQVPHFLAIAWMYREEYAHAGLCMLPVIDQTGAQTGRQHADLLSQPGPGQPGPVWLGHAGWIYLLGAWCWDWCSWPTALAFYRGPSLKQARRVLRTSLLYLPALLLVLILDAPCPGFSFVDRIPLNSRRRTIP